MIGLVLILPIIVLGVVAMRRGRYAPPTVFLCHRCGARYLGASGLEAHWRAHAGDPGHLKAFEHRGGE